MIALDLDPQASLLRWGKYREATNALNEVMIEPLESERLPHLRAILEGLAGVGFTLAIFDTAGSDNAAARFVTDAADICLLPTRPTRSDVAATAATFRAVFLAKRKAAFVLNQCPPTFRSSRTSDAAKDLTSLGVLAEPMLSTRMDFQDAMAGGLGVTEYAGKSRAAQEVEALWAGRAHSLKKGRVYRSSMITHVDRWPRSAFSPAPHLSEMNDKNNTQFHDRDLYVFCVTMADGKLTTTANPKVRTLAP